MNVDIMPLRQWLKASQETNLTIVGLLSVRYDLDGALAAGQNHLAWMSQQKLLLLGVQLFLSNHGVEIPWTEDSVQRDIEAVRLLETLNPALAEQVWDRWTKPQPEESSLRAEIDRTVELAVSQLGAGFLASREQVVIRWAEDTKVLRAMAKEFGLAQADNWYVSDSTISSPELDWYGEVLKTLES